MTADKRFEAKKTAYFLSSSSFAFTAASISS
jgi:hypothetical protein